MYIICINEYIATIFLYFVYVYNYLKIHMSLGILKNPMNRIASYFSASYRNANIQPIVPCAKGGRSWMKAEPVSTSNARRYSAPVFR